MKGWLRTAPTRTAVDEPDDDPAVHVVREARESIVTSHGMNDSGLFDLNLRDERLLPFEYQPAWSLWNIRTESRSHDPERLIAFDQFSLATVSDVVLTLQVECLFEPEGFAAHNLEHLSSTWQRAGESGLSAMFSAKRDFPNAWHRFLYPKGREGQDLIFDLGEDRFPFMFKGKSKRITGVRTFVKPAEGMTYPEREEESLEFALSRQEGEEAPITLSVAKWLRSASAITGLASALPITLADYGLGAWTFAVGTDAVTVLPEPLRKQETVEGETIQRLNPHAFDDIIVVFDYHI